MTERDMTHRGDWWWLAAVPPLLAGLLVLWIAGVGRNLWVVHLAAILVAAATAGLGQRLLRPEQAPIVTRVVVLMAFVALGLPLLGAGDAPRRWVALGPMALYVAPMVVPALLAVLGAGGHAFAQQWWRVVVPVLITLLLAAQPDASQATALLAGAIVGARPRDRVGSWLVRIGMAIAVAWAWTRPDPLAPVPYVEGVFALAFGVSTIAGLAVSASAVLFVAGLAHPERRRAPREQPGDAREEPWWLSGIAAYYTVLYGCSVAGLTPAPLIGFGTGPVLGFGLVVGVAPMLREPTS